MILFHKNVPKCAAKYEFRSGAVWIILRSASSGNCKRIVTHFAFSRWQHITKPCHILSISQIFLKCCICADLVRKNISPYLPISFTKVFTICEAILGCVINACSTVRINSVGSLSSWSISSIAVAKTEFELLSLWPKNYPWNLTFKSKDLFLC